MGVGETHLCDDLLLTTLQTISSCSVKRLDSVDRTANEGSTNSAGRWPLSGIGTASLSFVACSQVERWKPILSIRCL